MNKKSIVVSASLVLIAGSSSATTRTDFSKTVENTALNKLSRLKESQGIQKVADVVQTSVIRQKAKTFIGRGNSETIKFEEGVACYSNSTTLEKTQTIKRDCPVGKTASTNSLNEYISCPPGTYNNDTLCACYPCPNGAYSSEAGSTECLPCNPEGTEPEAYKYSTGTECKTCNWDDIGDSSYAELSYGASMNETSCIVCPRNYFIGTTLLKTDNQLFDQSPTLPEGTLTSEVKTPSREIIIETREKVTTEGYSYKESYYDETSGLFVKRGVCYACPNGEIRSILPVNTYDGQCVERNGKYCCLCGLDADFIPLKYDSVLGTCTEFSCGIGQIKLPDGTCQSCERDEIPDEKALTCVPCDGNNEAIVTVKEGGEWKQYCQTCAVNETKALVDGIYVCQPNEPDGPTECSTGNSYRMLAGRTKKIEGCYTSDGSLATLFQIESCGDDLRTKGGYIRSSSNLKQGGNNDSNRAWIGENVNLCGSSYIAKGSVYTAAETVFTNLEMGNAADSVSTVTVGGGDDTSSSVGFGVETAGARVALSNLNDGAFATKNIWIDTSSIDINTVSGAKNQVVIQGKASGDYPTLVGGANINATKQKVVITGRTKIEGNPTITGGILQGNSGVCVGKGTGACAVSTTITGALIDGNAQVNGGSVGGTITFSGDAPLASSTYAHIGGDAKIINGSHCPNGTNPVGGAVCSYAMNDLTEVSGGAIYGGTFIGKVQVSGGTISGGTFIGNIKIQGGTISGTPKIRENTSETTTASVGVTISGPVNISGSPVISGYYTFINGGSISGSAMLYGSGSATNSLTVSGGTITGGSKVDANSYPLTISGGTVNIPSEAAGKVASDQGKIVVTGGTITGGIVSAGTISGTAQIKGGSVITDSSSLLPTISGGILNRGIIKGNSVVSGGTITGGTIMPGARVEGSAQVLATTDSKLTVYGTVGGSAIVKTTGSVTVNEALIENYEMMEPGRCGPNSECFNYNYETGPSDDKTTHYTCKCPVAYNDKAYTYPSEQTTNIPSTSKVYGGTIVGSFLGNNVKICWNAETNAIDTSCNPILTTLKDSVISFPTLNNVTIWDNPKIGRLANISGSGDFRIYGSVQIFGGNYSGNPRLYGSSRIYGPTISGNVVVSNGIVYWGSITDTVHILGGIVGRPPLYRYSGSLSLSGSTQVTGGKVCVPAEHYTQIYGGSIEGGEISCRNANSALGDDNGYVLMYGGRVVSGGNVWAEVERPLFGSQTLYTTKVCPGAYMNFSVGTGNGDKTYGTCP
ncbi:MAG: hypothetical protein PHI50_01780 [Alphaproteobacteria bacterium]|nr:hypothetical protein [Alphaproteobacteria bacterium]